MLEIMATLTLSGANITNVQVIQLLFAKRGSIKSHKVMATTQIMAITVMQIQIAITTMLGSVSDVEIPLTLLNIAITITTNKIFN